MASIVVVDDDHDIADLVAGYLRREGHDALVTHSGADGLAIIQATKPRLAVIDWMMPELDGIEVARHIRSDPALRGTVLLMITARSAPEDIRMARAAGYDAIIGKPFRRGDLVAAASGLI